MCDSGETSTERPAEFSARPDPRSWTWVMLVGAVLLGVALVDFLVQNTRLESIEFFSVSGRVPVAVALLVAALVGATIVLVVGVARIRPNAPAP